MAAAVGIDIGTSNIKVVRVRQGVSTMLLNRPTPTRLDELLAVVFAGIGRATAEGPVDAVGIASMAESGYPLDDDGRALTPLLSWQDARDDTEIRALAARLGADTLFEATGARPGPKPSLAVWLWLRARQPGTFAAMHRWAGVADAVHLALTGELRTDHTLAGRTLAYRLPAAGEPLAGGFDPDLLAEAGLTPDRLPRVGLPGETPAQAAGVTAGLGLRPGTPVVVAGHDHQVAAWAAGVRTAGQVADSVGTAEALLNLVGRVPDRPAVRAQGMSVVRAIDGTTEALLAGTGTAGGFLQWLADRHTDGDVARLLGTVGSPTAMNALAEDSWLLPYPAGRQCPEPDPDARVRLIGPPPAQLGVAGLEAVGYQAQWVLDTQSALTGRRPQRLSLSGRPLHRTPLWARIKATLAGTPAALTIAPEPVATGAALLALHRAGLGGELPLPDERVEPLEGLRGRYEKRLLAFIASARAPVTTAVPPRHWSTVTAWRDSQLWRTMYPANITRDEANARSLLLSTSRYRVTVDLTGSPSTFTSTSTITFRSAAGATFVDLIADSIVEATLDGEALDITGFNGERLGFEVTEGEHVLAITAVCRYSNTGEGLHRFVDPVDSRVYCYTQLEVADARRVYACFDQPDLKASFEFAVIAPAHWTVLSNSPEVEPMVAGDLGRWEFAPTPPISTYITALIAGEYHTVRTSYRGREAEIPFSLSCRASMAPYLDAERLFATTAHGFDVFEEHFGEPYPFTDYAQVFVPEFNAGAMENAGCVTIRDEYLYRSRVTSAAYESRDNTILHELAHMWFGDLVTMTWWDDLWLNESFAEWASHFAQDEIRKVYGGEDPWATFCNQRKTWAYRQDQLPSTHPIAADMVDLEAVELNFDGITYAKGASALRQLVAFVGLEPFLAGVRTYFGRHAWGNTQLTDLLRALEEASGRDLAFFTGQWLQTAGVNTLTSEYELDDRGRFSRFTVVQHASEQWPTLRRHRIGIGCYDPTDEGIEHVHRVELDIDGERTDVPALVGVPAPAVVLLNDGDLSYAKIRIDRGLDVVVARIHEFRDPVARALLWGATWDMCRDAQLPASDYVELVIRGVAVETDLTAVTAVLAQAEAAVRYYVPPAARPALAGRWTAGLVTLLKDAEPGSDHQLAIVRALATSLTTAAGAELLRAWLAGDEVPEGLVVDTDLRWRFVTQLAQLGGLDDAGIDAELARDNTATGAEKAAGARAARPDDDAKAEAWRLAIEDPSVPNATHTQICAHFWALDQEAVLKPYVDAWFEVMADIAAQRNGWGQRSLAIRKNVGELLFPRPFGDRALVARIDEWMATTELTDSVRRMVSERRDDVERALRCQEAAG